MHTSGWPFDVPLLSRLLMVIRNRVPSSGSFMCTLQVEPIRDALATLLPLHALLGSLKARWCAQIVHHP